MHNVLANLSTESRALDNFVIYRISSENSQWIDAIHHSSEVNPSLFFEFAKAINPKFRTSHCPIHIGFTNNAASARLDMPFNSRLFSTGAGGPAWWDAEMQCGWIHSSMASKTAHLIAHLYVSSLLRPDKGVFTFVPAITEGLGFWAQEHYVSQTNLNYSYSDLVRQIMISDKYIFDIEYILRFSYKMALSDRNKNFWSNLQFISYSYAIAGFLIFVSKTFNDKHFLSDLYGLGVDWRIIIDALAKIFGSKEEINSNYRTYLSKL